MKLFGLKKNGIFFVMSILLVTKILGFLKLRTFAQLFGASHELDIFWAAFTIPDMLFMILVAGSLNSAIIPIFSDVFHKEGKEKLNKFFNHLFLVVSVACFIIAFVLFIFAPQLTGFIVDSHSLQKMLSFSSSINIGDYNEFIKLTRIMLLSPILLGASSMITAYLQIKKEFFVTSLAPLFYNLAMIVGPVIFVVMMGAGVEGIAYSAVIGSLLHLLIQIPTFITHFEGRMSFSPKTLIEAVKDSNLKRSIKLAVPRTIGIVGEQVNGVINTLISFTLAAGALSSYKFAFSLHLFPINIIGSAIAQLALPDLAQYSDPKDRVKFSEIFNKSIQFALYLVLPIVAILIVLRLPIVRLVYGSGAFDWRATILTAWCLILLGFSILSQTIVQIVLRAFYALKETWLPLLAIAIGLVVNIILAYYLTNFFSHYYDWRPILDQMWVQVSSANGNGFLAILKSFFQDFLRWSSSRGDSDLAVGGLSLSLSIAYTIETVLLFVLLNGKAKILTWSNTVKPFLIKSLNTILMAMGMYFVFKLFDFRLDTTKTMSILVLTSVTTTYGLFSYWIGSRVFKIKEIDIFEQGVIKIFNKLFKR